MDSQIAPEGKTGIDAKGQKKIEQLKKGFIGTVLNFGANNEFAIKYPDNIPKFMKELEFLNNKQWKIEKGVRIAIGTEEDDYSLLAIIVSIKQEKIYFIFDETALILEVNKQ